MKSNDNPPLRNTRHAAEQASVLACAVLIAVVVVAAWLSNRSDSASEREFVLRQADDMTLVLQTYTRDTLLSVDDVVRRLKRDFERDGLRTDLQRLMQDHLDIADYITLASVADAQGRVILSTLPILRDASIADVAHFRAHVERDTGESFISKPVLDRASGKWSFHLSRRINQSDGTFAGVAIVAVDLSYWERLLREGHFGEAGGIALIGRDGAARAAFKRNAKGQTLMQRDWRFIARAAERAPHGRLTATSPEDRGEIWAYRELKVFPLLVAVSVDEAFMAGRLDAVRTRNFGGALIIVVLTALFTAALLFFISRQRRHVTETAHIVQAWRQSEERFRSVFDQAAIGMGLRPVGRRDLPWQKVNRKLCDFLGYTEKELLAQPRSAINAPEDANFTAKLDEQLISGEVVNYSREKQFLRKDGSRVWGQVTVTVLHYLDGQPAQVLSIVQDINDRKRAETAMLESEERYRRLFDANPLPVMIRDEESLAILAVNQAMVDKYGYSREQFSEMTVLHLQSAATRDDLRRVLDTQSRDEFYKARRTHVTHDGTGIEVEITARPIEFNGIAARLVVINDVSLQIASERALRESEGHLRAIIAAEPECVAIVAPDGRLLEMNPAGLRMLEAGSLEEMRRRPFLKQVAPKYRRAFVRLQHQLLGGSSGVLEFEAAGIAGRHRWLEIHAAPLHDASGAITALLGIARDVTERRLARDELAAERNLLRTVIDNLPDRIRVKGRDLKFTLANDAWRQARVPGHRDVMGLTNDDFMPYDMVALAEEEDRGVLDTGEPSRPREVVDGPPEDPRWFITTKMPLRDDAGNVVGIVGISRDVTDFKRRSVEVEKLNAVLEARVTERTAQLTSANEELEAFASSVSHDLRAPLRHIDGMAVALVEDYADKLDASGKDYLTRIRAAAVRMAGLIEDLLRLSQVTRAELKIADTDLSGIARSLVEDLRREQPQRVVNVQVASGLRAQADPGMLRAALSNLIRNAWKFTGKKAEATIEFGATQRNGITVYFVRDDGAGFDMTHAGRLFDAFQRLHAEREFPGTGIGLATVRRVMRRHRGDAWAESAVGQGATFYFTLGARPEIRVAEPPQPALALVARQELPAVPVAAKPLVLLVDDDADVLTLTSRALAPDGYQVLTAGRGEDALALLRERSVSVVVSDFSMPGMNGAQLLAQVMAMQADTLRIIVSGQEINSDMKAGMERGAIQHYFEKQHSYDAVRDCIRGWLARRARDVGN